MDEDRLKINRHLSLAAVAEAPSQHFTHEADRLAVVAALLSPTILRKRKEALAE